MTVLPPESSASPPGPLTAITSEYGPASPPENSHERPLLTIVCCDLSSNAVGRALVLHDLLVPQYAVRIVGFNRATSVWNHADSSYPIHAFRGTTTVSLLRNHRENRAQISGSRLLIASKPEATSLGYAKMLRANLPLLLDIDDYQTGLYRDAGWLQNLRMLARFPFHPNNYFTAKSLERRASGTPMMFSSAALRDFFGAQGAVVPHVKPPEFYLNDASQPLPAPFDRLLRREDDDLVLGFIGTPRKHKGIDFLIRNIDRLHVPGRRVRLLIAGGKVRVSHPRIINLPKFPFHLLPAVYSAIDVLLLLQMGSQAAQLQLPSKLFDAMFLKKPVLATRTGPLSEYVADEWLLDGPPSVGGLNEKLHAASFDDPSHSFRLQHRDVLHSARQSLSSVVASLTSIP